MLSHLLLGHPSGLSGFAAMTLCIICPFPPIRSHASPTLSFYISLPKQYCRAKNRSFSVVHYFLQSTAQFLLPRPNISPKSRTLVSLYSSLYERDQVARLYRVNQQSKLLGLCILIFLFANRTRQAVYRGADKSLARPWKVTSYSKQDLQHYTKTYGVQTTGIYCCCL